MRTLTVDWRERLNRVNNLLLKAIRDPGRAWKKLGYYWWPTVLGHTDFTPFIVLARSRTGSNLLITLLESHPHIRADGEILHSLEGRDGADVLAKTFCKQPIRIKARGFKVFYYHPIDDDSGGVWRTLAGMDHLRVIHLKRRNVLRTLVSRKVAGARDEWVTESGAPASFTDKAVALAARELAEGFARTRAWEEGGDEMFSRHPLLSVHYEDLADDPNGVFREITDFLGVPYARPSTTLRRQNPERLSDLVTNYEELKGAFQGTELEEFFED